MNSPVPATRTLFLYTEDDLTGLWNRESILSLLFGETDRAQRMGTSLGLLLLAIDRFSEMKAELGPEAGDRILREMAGRLRRYLRSYDLFGRTGDAEFLIVLPGCNACQARHLASRMQTIMLQKPFPAPSEEVKVTVSIGLAQSQGRSPLVVLHEAEQSLAAAKQEVSSSGPRDARTQVQMTNRNLRQGPGL